MKLSEKEKYERMNDYIQEIGFGEHIDASVDAENCIDENGNYLREEDGEPYWIHMYHNMINSVGMRLAEQGISASDYGIPY